MPFVAFDVAADVMLVRAVLGTNNLRVGDLYVQEISHRAGHPGRGG